MTKQEMETRLLSAAKRFCAAETTRSIRRVKFTTASVNCDFKEKSDPVFGGGISRCNFSDWFQDKTTDMVCDSCKAVFETLPKNANRERTLARRQMLAWWGKLVGKAQQ